MNPRVTRRLRLAPRTVRRWLPAAIALGALQLHTPALAQADMETSYAGLGVGMASYKFRNSPAGGSDFCGFANLLSCEDSPVGFKGFVGYNLTRNLGVELSYYNAGRASVTYDGGLLGTVNQKVILNGYSLSAVGTLPLGAAFVAGRLGVSAATVARKDEIGGQSTQVDRSRAQVAIGVSGGATVWRNVAVRLDWDRYRGETRFGEKFEADLITINALYRFQ